MGKNMFMLLLTLLLFTLLLLTLLLFLLLLYHIFSYHKRENIFSVQQKPKKYK